MGNVYFGVVRPNVVCLTVRQARRMRHIKSAQDRDCELERERYSQSRPSPCVCTSLLTSAPTSYSLNASILLFPSMSRNDLNVSLSSRPFSLPRPTSTLASASSTLPFMTARLVCDVPRGYRLPVQHRRTVRATHQTSTSGPQY